MPLIMLNWLRRSGCISQDTNLLYDYDEDDDDKYDDNDEDDDDKYGEDDVPTQWSRELVERQYGTRRQQSKNIWGQIIASLVGDSSIWWF